VTETPAPPAELENPIGNPHMPDHLVWSTIADAVPGTHEGDKATELGEHVYSAVRTATLRERNRITKVLDEIAVDLMQRAKAAEGEAAAALLQGNERGAREVQARAAANAGIGQYIGRFLSIAVALPPGECRRCLGQKEVRSTLAPGQAVPCPACSAPAPAPSEGAPST
jgi:hypothetical protein